MLIGEVNIDQRKLGWPHKSFREGLKNDLKAFELWPVYQQDKNLQTFTESRDEWRKKINKNYKNSRQTGKRKEQIKVISKNKIQIK